MYIYIIYGRRLGAAMWDFDGMIKENEGPEFAGIALVVPEPDKPLSSLKSTGSRANGGRRFIMIMRVHKPRSRHVHSTVITIIIHNCVYDRPVPSSNDTLLFCFREVHFFR